MELPIRRRGVLELRLSICLRIQCLVSLMTIVMYGRPQLSMGDITTSRTVDTIDHNPKHASSIRGVQMSPSYPTKFLDRVGLVLNSTATTPFMVKASDIGPSSHSMDLIGLGADSARITILLSLSIISRFSATAYLCFVTCHIFASSLL